ncbi:MAG TPA: ABC transporter ATP-binding protein [Thermodesulfobacteriota bacterium]|nr:ABC transporter ATP-binding protein [Thermodesulfobacteriota bacterium]
MLKVKKLAVSYAGVDVLREVSLEVKEGEIVSVVGANGGGKTTLLKTISGLLKPSSGSIEFMNEKIHSFPPHEICKRRLIQVPEGRQLFPKMKVIHNLEMGAYLPEARKNSARSLDRVYDLFPIFRERKNQKTGSLSGGEQQMLAIGRALMSMPKLLMLDEPSEGLSPLYTSNVFDTLRILGEQGLTILVVSQEVERSLELSQRAYVLENGQIALEGESDELLNKDKVRASYLGM